MFLDDLDHMELFSSFDDESDFVTAMSNFWFKEDIYASEDENEEG